jgi:hypothetical protein
LFLFHSIHSYSLLLFVVSFFAALSVKESGGSGGGGVVGGASSGGGVMVVDIGKDNGCKSGHGGGDGRGLPTPSKLQHLKYSGYSAEFLDRVEPNGNIPHKQTAGKQHRKYAVFDVWEMPLVNPDWTVMALDKFLSHPDVFLFEDC